MKTYIILTVLIIFFIYMLVWTLKLRSAEQRKLKVKRMQQLRERKNTPKSTEDTPKRDYWYNIREVKECPESEDAERYYHYFDNVQEAVKGLLLEMYDCGLVRTDELEEIAYGENHFSNVDLSFLKDIEKEVQEAVVEESGSKLTDDTTSVDDIIQVEGVMNTFFETPTTVVDAAKNLKEDDPGITDIHGTLSEGVEQVIAAVDQEKKLEDEKNAPIYVKEKKSVEKARRDRERTSTPEIRNKVYESWGGYVKDLYKIVNISAEDDTRKKIRKALTDYGHNDVDVLLESPE